jgi:hypothetical protein
MYEPLEEEDAAPAPASVEAPSPPDVTPLVPTIEQAKAMGVIAAQPFVNVSGTAGCGKTYLAKFLAEGDPSVLLCSTTGIAAVNLGEGQTINSALGYYDTASLKDAYVNGFLQAKLRKLRKAGIRTILLDEKSMLDAFQLTYLVRGIDDVNQGKALEAVGEGDATAAEVEANNPQMGLVLVGDFGQLPPVKAPFAFESAEWPRFADHTITLTQILRQVDAPFITALRHVRAGRAGWALEYFTEAKFSLTTDDHFDGTTVFARNDAVDRYNQLRLDECAGAPMSFTASRWGKQSGEWKGIPDQLDIKVGALVMVLANRRYPRIDEDDLPGLQYCNGDLAEVLDQATIRVEDRLGRSRLVTRCYVRLHRTKSEQWIWPVTRDFLIPMDPGRRTELREAGTPEKIKERWEIAGQITYMPLRLAWGTTVHKSQGLSLDQVQINIRDGFFGQPGMLFVALSRARTPEGLRIVGNARTFVARCATNPAVVPWL